MPPFEHAIAATRGARDYQEDSAAFWPEGGQTVSLASEAAAHDLGGFAVLADGMGGHAGGALASRTACEKFLAAVGSGTAGSTTDRLISALRAANAAIAAKIKENPLLSGMGSTLIGTAFNRSGIEWVSVGDSPLFLFRRGEVAVLNEDHSLAPELDRLVAEGKLTANEARRDPRRHMLRSAVTGEDIDLLDVSRRPLTLEAGDYVVLASDGIATLDTAEIARIIQGYANDGAAAVAKALIRAVESIREPYQDNATVLVVRALP
ncbi:serine/threonine-protein phosphatase [Hyphomicrobium methylovorum]|uniref:PP2C family protein-serine/threonine phosphatase n=1 Tax=Hyphomicrobium methylovorum TaxID=84 RepID=UPI0015E659BB|nr:protein phosphatase 2C domain-containing protein [Hyphomicrobium methylovorum]MBA2125984.1 serine/threonine-protein phosphatase [Hyphomicrobium methylovorum]